MADRAPFTKLLTNIPLVVEQLKYADYFHSQTAKDNGWAASLKLTGTIAGIPGAVTIPLPCADELIGLGYLEDAGQDKWGNPAFKVVDRKPLTILRIEDGKKKLTLLNPEPGQTVPVSHPKNVKTTPASAPAPPQAPKPSGERPVSNIEEWAVLEATYGKCVEIAGKAWGNKTWGGEALGMSDTGLVAAAATIFIQATKAGLKAFPAPPQPGPLSEMPRALQPDADDGMPF